MIFPPIKKKEKIENLVLIFTFYRIIIFNLCKGSEYEAATYLTFFNNRPLRFH